MYIIWNGIDSRTIPGLMICELPPITKPKMKTQIIKIDGRDGDIVEELGYESYTKTISIGLTKNYNVDQVIKYFTGKGDLTLSNEPDKVYKCQIIDQINYEKLLRFKKATIKFHTQPYKYALNEPIRDEIIVTQFQIDINNKGNVDAKPIITMHGNETVNLIINDIEVFQYRFDGSTNNRSVTIDSMKEEAYFDGVLKNEFMSGNFPVFKPGVNIIKWGNRPTRITIETKSRWI